MPTLVFALLGTSPVELQILQGIAATFTGGALLTAVGIVIALARHPGGLLRRPYFEEPRYD